MKMQSEFDEKVNLDCQIPANSTIETELKIERCEAVCEGDSILVRCHVSAVIYVFDISEVKALSVCESLPDQIETRDRSTVTVYYPKKGEKLFDVAKRYMTTAAKIAKDNALTESALSSFDSPDSLAGVRKLIIR